MSILIKGMEMPTTGLYFVSVDETGGRDKTIVTVERMLGNRDVRHIVGSFELLPVSPHGRLKKRVVYREEVYNTLESARINALDGILTDRYKNGFHDGLKRALEILANEVQDVPTIISAEEGE